MTREQVFWGWGEPGAGPSLPAHAAGFLRGELGVSGAVVARPVELDAVTLPAPRLPERVRDRLAAIVGAEAVAEDRAARVLRAAGKSYLDLLAQRAGHPEHAPDAVVRPATHDQVAGVLRACAEADVAVVPFGGGTSVVGGVAPLRGECEAVITLDLGRMQQVVAVDRASGLAVLEPGLRLPEADFRLGRHGFTLGHYPQSYEWATVGGCVATRSAGQASTGLGRIDQNVVAVRCATPAGDLETLEVPAAAAGPDLRQLLVGSEGVLGVLTRVALRVRPLPAVARHEGFAVASFAEGLAALRALEQRGEAPDVVRLSDEDETRMSLALAGRGARRRLGEAYLRLRGRAGGCLVVAGWSGADASAVARRRTAAARVLRQHGAVALGQSPGRAWVAGRYAGPYLRDDLLDRGVLVETLETATTWSRVESLRAAVRTSLQRALEAGGVRPLVVCHVSHLYPTGASLYFTVLARADPDDPAGQWRAAKDAASAAIAAERGTLSHHHAVGRDHARWLRDEVGDLGVELLRALKRRADPAGIMNPGKLLPDDAA